MSVGKIKVKKVCNATDFMGLKIEGETIEISVPESFRYNEEDLKKSYPDILLFLKSISLAKTLNAKKMNASNNFELGKTWAIESYLFIIRDFIENGFYYQKEKVYSKNNHGQINWKRTLKKVPLISDNNIVYPNFISSKVIPSNSKITQIYKLCLDLALRRIGWVFDYTFKIEVDKTMVSEEMISLMKQELSSTFDDLKRIRFKHLLNILEDVDDAANSNYHTYGVMHYYYVFEKMIDRMFGNISDNAKRKYNPPTYWVIGEDSTHRNSPLSPDTIHNFEYEGKKITYIIDSKMYSYGSECVANKLPGSQSIQKQITYGDYVGNVIAKDTETRNVFILPYDKNNNEFSNKNIYCFGYASAEWRNPKKDHDYIFGYFIDFNYLLNNYTREVSKIKEIYNTIEKKLYDIKNKNII